MEKNAGFIVDEMMRKDLFSQWLGIEVLELKPGCCRLQMQTRDDMCNGFGIAHGGICYSFADTALAFASNSRGRQAVSVDTSIAHIKPLAAGTTIFAEAKEINYGNRIAHYEVRIEDESGQCIAIFKGSVFITSKEW